METFALKEVASLLCKARLIISPNTAWPRKYLGFFYFLTLEGMLKNIKNWKLLIMAAMFLELMNKISIALESLTVQNKHYNWKQRNYYLWCGKIN